MSLLASCLVYVGSVCVPAGDGAEALTITAQPAATATFHCLGLVARYEGDSNANSACTPRYRAKGEANWREGHPLYADREGHEFRGSLVNLQPATIYEVELRYQDPDGVSPRATASLVAQTWSEEFPVAQTIWIEPGVHREPLLINQSGSPTGYILYSARPGRERETIVDVEGNADNNVIVAGDYVIVRGLTLKNARASAVDILRRHHVVIESCFITGWGGEGGRGRPGELDAGVYARNGGAQIVIQNNVIRLPRGCANDWSTGHPEGPQTISLIQTEGNHVIRYNELSSDDAHRYNDTVGGGWNSDLRGFPCRDTDIYGNHVSDCNDDGIECDGGGINIRVWGNRIERVFCGISLAPVIKGPAYVWRNVITDFPGAAFKLGEGDRKGYGAVYLYHNTVCNSPNKSGIADWGGQSLFRHTTSRNNILYLANGPVISDRRADPTNDYDYDLLQGRIKLNRPTELHAVRGEPSFVDGPAGNFLLRPDSAAIDKGAPIPGFNDGFRGQAPDIGAFELGDSAPAYGPR